MATAMSDMSFWIKFFKEAGIPAGDAANYAVMFSDNRISRTMLLDLTKDYLNDMGIRILGDVISILKHAKSVHTQEVRDRVLKENVGGRITPTREPPLQPKRSTPASRTIAHHIGTDRSASPTVTMAPVSTKISKSLSDRLGKQPTADPGNLSARLGKQPTVSNNLSARLGIQSSADVIARESPSTVITLNSSKPKEVVPVPKKRRVFPEHEGKYKVTMPAGTTPRTQKILEMQRSQAEAQRILAEEKKRSGQGLSLKESVFSRLGSEKPKALSTATAGPTITITGLDTVTMAAASQSSVFNRLGGKTAIKRVAATSTVTFGDDDLDDELYGDDGQTLEYAGVLKPGASPSKKVKLEAANKITKLARTTLAAKASTDGFKSDGLFARKGSQQNVKYRLGTNIAEASSTTQSVPAGNGSKDGIQSRLGSGQLDKLTITVGGGTTSGSTGGAGIFSRLGKTK